VVVPASCLDTHNQLDLYPYPS